MASIRVFLLDDHEMVRRGVTGLLEAEGDIVVVGEASSAAGARTRIAATRPDVALLDMRLPDGNGVDVCRDVRSQDPNVQCIILTAYDDDEAVYAAVLAGAAGYILKTIRGSGLIDGVRKVAAGENLLDPFLRRRVTDSMQKIVHSDLRVGSLSARERQVLALIADGLTNREIGANLALAEKTVKNYVSSLLSKLGLQRRTQAVALELSERNSS